jgi:hypothetical protein
MKRIVAATLFGFAVLWSGNAAAVPFTATFTASGPFHISFINTTPAQFDFGITAEAIEPALAGTHVELDRVTLSGTGISNSGFALFDTEIHLGGTTIGLPAGQFDDTLMNPVTGITRTADAQLRVVPFRNAPFRSRLDANFNMNFSVSFVAPNSVVTSPPNFNTKQLPVTSLDLSDGLHAQVFLWTLSPFTDATFSDLTLRVEGDAVPTAVPEPATLALIGSALGALGALRSRLRRLSLP